MDGFSSKKAINSKMLSEKPVVDDNNLAQIVYLNLLDFLLVPIEIAINGGGGDHKQPVIINNYVGSEVFFQNQQLWIDNFFLFNYINSNFYSGRVPSISLIKYVERLIHYAPCSKECYIIGFVYLSKFYKEKVSESFFFNIKTIYRLFLTSVLLASKFIDDKFYSNEYYAKIGGITLEELNKLEIEFLQTISFKCFVSKSEYTYFQMRLQFQLPNEAYFLEWTDPNKMKTNDHDNEDDEMVDDSYYYDKSLISTIKNNNNTSSSSRSSSTEGVAATSTDYSNSDFTDDENMSPRSYNNCSSSSSISPREIRSVGSVGVEKDDFLNCKNSYLFQIKLKKSTMRSKIDSFIFINKRSGSTNLFKNQTRNEFYKKHSKFLEGLLKLENQNQLASI